MDSCRAVLSLRCFITTVSLLCLLFGFAAGSTSCPSEPATKPCNCTEIKDGISLRCRGPGDQDRISAAIEGLDGRSGQLELVLESLSMPAIPEGTIRKTTSLRLKDVHIGEMIDRTPLPRLNDLVIDSSAISDEPWTLLKRTSALKHLKVSNLAMPVIGLEFKVGVPASVAYLDLRKTATTDLRSGSMDHLTKLKYLLMVDVPVERFPRDTLPVEMRELHTLILCNTQLKTLEAGFFEGMPNLEVLMLSGNHFKTLDYPLLAPVHKHLTHLLAQRNPLLCECNIIWLSKYVQLRDSIKVLATCTDPKSGERREVSTLNEEEYCF